MGVKLDKTPEWRLPLIRMSKQRREGEGRCTLDGSVKTPDSIVHVHQMTCIGPAA